MPSASPKLGQFAEQLTQWLTEEYKFPRARRRSAHRLFEGLQEIGYIGAYDSVQRFVKRWKSGNTGPTLTEAFVLMLFQPGDACQFYCSQVPVELGGIMCNQGGYKSPIQFLDNWLIAQQNEKLVA